MTWDGPRPLGDLAGSSPRLLGSNGIWRAAPVRSFGTQRLWRIVIGRNGIEKELFATGEHRWFVLGTRGGQRARVERTTQELKAGQTLWSVSPLQSPATRGQVPSGIGVARGFVFGDGTRAKKGSTAHFYGAKDEAMLRFFPEPRTVDRHSRADCSRIHGLPAYFKELPSLDEAPSYLYGWLSGYFAADGCVADSMIVLHSAVRENLEFVRVLSDRLGIGTYGIRTQLRRGLGSAPSEIFAIRFVAADLTAEFFALARHRSRFENWSPAYARRRWQVRRVEKTSRIGEVFCAQVAHGAAFALEDNILTGNCFACRVGGGAVDLVSALEGGPTGRELRGEDFRAAKAKALDALGLEQEHKEMARC